MLIGACNLMLFLIPGVQVAELRSAGTEVEVAITASVVLPAPSGTTATSTLFEKVRAKCRVPYDSSRACRILIGASNPILFSDSRLGTNGTLVELDWARHLTDNERQRLSVVLYDPASGAKMVSQGHSFFFLFFFFDEIVPRTQML